jgi:[glutamine synthetase] adenylyltransferase / [glutamine synthetase]-adenylyl-L-tyrosine phosphorylase
MNRGTLRGALLRAGFVDAERAEASLAAIHEVAGDSSDALVAPLGATADPDRALAALVDVADELEDPAELWSALADDEGTAMRLLSVLGASEALGRHLRRHPEQWRELQDPLLGSTRPAAYALRASLLSAVGAEAHPWTGPEGPVPVAALDVEEAMDALRVEYRRLLLRLASRDLAHHLGVDDVAAELSDLAAGTLEAALAVARRVVGERHACARLAVLALGKCGGHELNYVSDVDVVFVFEAADGEDETEARRVATRLATELMKVCGEHTGEGTIWPVDANLRPEGKAGPLVRTLAGHVGYYEKWAATWEFQALLKARPVAGDLTLGAAYVEALSPMVWHAAERENFVTDVQRMRRRVVEHIPSDEAERQLKLGSGGLRDVEFAVQLLQLVHGRGDPDIRQPTTLSALAALTRGGYVGREDGQALHDAYAFLRTLEHRMQLEELRRIAVVPDDEDALRRLGRSTGALRDPAGELDRWWRHHRREVRRLHEKLFYRPLLGAVARIPGEDTRLSPDAARTRLAALGYDDPAAALRHLEALTAGVSRASAIQRTLLPVMLEWFADAPDPDAGLFGFRRISESLGDTPWYLRLLRDEGQVAQRLASLLATSRYATDLLQREPEGVRMLGDALRPVESEALTAEMLGVARRRANAEDAVRAVRGVRRRELFRTAAGDLAGTVDVTEVAEALSRLTDATLESTLEIALRTVAEQRGLDERPARMAVVAMGRYGGFELSYASDADVMFVAEAAPGTAGEDDPQLVTSYSRAVVGELRRLLSLPASDPPLEVDADLRPEGRQGPMVRTLASYEAYYARWSHVWEFQALLRADAVVGDEDLRRRFHAMIDPLRFPEGGLDDHGVTEVRRIKARVDDERLPRGADRRTHLKLGRGGLADVEWTVQLLQMQHAGRVEALRTPRTLPALAAAVEADLVDAGDAELLADSWRMVSRLRNAVTLVRGKAADQIPSDPREAAGVAALMGYAPGHTDELLNDHLRTTRRASEVVERVFWG